MRYKRKEAFRFQFQKPIDGVMTITRVNGSNVQSNPESVEIMDVSPNGLKFKSILNLSLLENRYLLEITFQLEGRKIHILGEPIWKKNEGKLFSYGFNGLNDKRTNEEIIQALKDYSKRINYEMKQKPKKNA